MSDLATHPRIDALLASGLGIHTVVHLPEVTSTNDVALQRLRDGDTPGVVVVGDRQTKGRGRAGRAWLDGPGPEASLMATVTTATPASGQELVPLAVGLALVDMGRAHGVHIQLKWPNDAMVDGRKCAGTLVERHHVDGRDVLLIGVGVDVDWRAHDRGDEESASWTSLAEETGRDIDRGEVLADLIGSLSTWMRAAAHRPDELLVTYRAACATVGADVVATLPGGDFVTGRARDVDRTGRLLIDTGGELVAVTAGDVVHLRRDG